MLESIAYLNSFEEEYNKLKKRNLEDNEIFDKITPVGLSFMNSLNKYEQSIIDAFIIRKKIRRKVKNGKLTTNHLSNFLTTKLLSEETKIPSKELSVYLRRLSDKSLVSIDKVSKVCFKYDFNFVLFKRWYLFRYLR